MVREIHRDVSLTNIYLSTVEFFAYSITWVYGRQPNCRAESRMLLHVVYNNIDEVLLTNHSGTTFRSRGLFSKKSIPDLLSDCFGNALASVTIARVRQDKSANLIDLNHDFLSMFVKIAGR